MEDDGEYYSIQIEKPSVLGLDLKSRSMGGRGAVLKGFSNKNAPKKFTSTLKIGDSLVYIQNQKVDELKLESIISLIEELQNNAENFPLRFVFYRRNPPVSAILVLSLHTNTINRISYSSCNLICIT